MAVPNQTALSVANDYTTIDFIVRQILGGVATAALVKVESCTNAGGVAPVGMVNVSLLVDMVTGDGQTVAHGTVFNVPYTRVQGGANALILDPQPGDLGVCVFAARDISAVKANPTAARDRKPRPGASPGSKRTFSLSDALYVGGFLNGTPTNYVQFVGDGITIKSPTAVTIEAPTINLKGAVVQTVGDVSMSQNLTVQGTITGNEVIAQGTALHTHIHSGVTPGGGNSGAPV